MCILEKSEINFLRENAEINFIHTNDCKRNITYKNREKEEKISIRF